MVRATNSLPRSAWECRPDALRRVARGAAQAGRVGRVADRDLHIVSQVGYGPHNDRPYGW